MRPSSVEPARPGRFNVRFAASQSLKDKIERLAEVLGVREPDKNLAALLEDAVDMALDQKDPQRRLARREARAARKREKEAAEQDAGGATAIRTPGSHVQSVRPDELDRSASGVEGARAEKSGSTNSSRRANEVDPEAKTSPPRRLRLSELAEGSRYVPAELRDRVFARAGYRCQFTGANGRRCAETTRLEVDHVEPFGKNGPTTDANLRCLCTHHNRWEAERHYGAEFMRKKIAESRAKR